MDYYISHGYFMEMHECYSSTNAINIPLVDVSIFTSYANDNNIQINNRIIEKLSDQYSHIQFTTFPTSCPWYANINDQRYHDRIGFYIKPEHFLNKQ
jgi:hypothetical protein